MLNDCIKEYIKAIDANDIKLANKLERDLAILGMDKYTLEILVNEFRKDK